MSSWTPTPAVKWLEHPSHVRACRRRVFHYTRSIIEQIEDYNCSTIDSGDDPHQGCLRSPWYYHSSVEIDEDLWISEGRTQEPADH